MPNPEATARGTTGWTRMRRLLVGLVVCRGLVFLGVMPPFEGWDEYQHVGYVQHLRETGNRPVLGVAKVPAALLPRVLEFPQGPSARGQFGWPGALDSATYWAPGPRHPDPSRADLAAVPLYQAQHGPLYYRLAAPLYAALGGAGNLKAAVGGLRAANLLLIAAAVWVALGALGRLVRAERDAAPIGLLIATHPLFLINGVRVANDALGILLATLAIAAALDLERRRPLAGSLVVGTWTGLAIAAKTVHLGLLPFVGACWLMGVARRRETTRKRAWLSAGVLALACVVPILPDLLWNLAHHGMPTVLQEAIKNRSEGRTGRDLIAAALRVDWREQMLNLWLRGGLLAGGWSFLDTSYLWLWRARHLILAGLLGWAWNRPTPARPGRSPFRSGRTPVACLVLCLGYSAALGVHMIQSTLAWGASTTNPWYACAATPWYLALIAGGALCWPLGRLRMGLPILLATTFLVSEQVLVWGAMVTTYSGGAGGMEGLRRLARLQPGPLGTTTLLFGQVGTLTLFAASVVVLSRSKARPVAAARDDGPRSGRRVVGRRLRRPAVPATVGPREADGR